MATEETTGSLPELLTKKQQMKITVITAIVISIAFQAMTIARNNYGPWHPEFIAIETVVALAASFLASHVTKGLVERGAQWARSYVASGEGLLYRILAALPVSTARAAVMVACLSAINATVVPTMIFRETVELPPVAIVIRFLADIPQGILLCLAVYLLVTRKKQQ